MIRAAAEGDVAGILAIWNPVIRDTLATFNPVEKTAGDIARMIVERAAAGHGFLVAEGAGGIAGFAPTGSSGGARAMRARWSTR